MYIKIKFDEIQSILNSEYQRGYQVGYSDGYCEGHEIGYKAGFVNDSEDYGCIPDHPLDKIPGGSE